MPEIRQTTRRNLLKASALTLAGLTTRRRVWGSSSQPAHETLGVAVVGVDGQGFWNLHQLLQAGAAVVALCDVDERRAAEARKLCPNARFFVDFRRMLDEADRDIDAVLVATPDHTHAVATLAALHAGKHVYCEKPLTHTVWEARQVIAAARRYNRVTQMGTQIHAGSNYRRVVELIRTGAIGRVREVHVWCPTVWSGGQRPAESPIPPGLHWDLWLGPAPDRPYADKAYTPAAWRGWWDFGGGGHADMACHFIDLPFWALGLGHPRTVEADGPPVDAESTPDRLTVRYEFPAPSAGSFGAASASPDHAPLRLVWSVGTNQPHDPIPTRPAEAGQTPPQHKIPGWGDGVLFVGEKGMLVSDYGRHQLLPVDDFAGFTPPDPFIRDSIGHHREFVEACKGRGRTSCPFDYSGVLTQAVLLGNVAYRSGRRIEWDPVHMKIPNAPEAEKYLTHPYRDGWGPARI